MGTLQLRKKNQIFHNSTFFFFSNPHLSPYLYTALRTLLNFKTNLTKKKKKREGGKNTDDVVRHQTHRRTYVNLLCQRSEARIKGLELGSFSRHFDVAPEYRGKMVCCADIKLSIRV